MSADKRTVSTDALETLGTIISPGEKRDAIHLAVLPVEAGEILVPGQSIYLIDDRANGGRVVARGHMNGIGIVDPFLDNDVQPGESFWMVLRPRLITSLRHVWTHPALPDEPGVTANDVGAAANKAMSEQWLRDFCARSDCPKYEHLIAMLMGETVERDHDWHVRAEFYGDALIINGDSSTGDIPPEFWTHAEIVTGKKFQDRPTYFSCSC